METRRSRQFSFQKAENPQALGPRPEKHRSIESTRDIKSVPPELDVCLYPSPLRHPPACNPATMSDVVKNDNVFKNDVELQKYLDTLRLASAVLELNPEEEAFFKSETGIQDTEELRKHIFEVREDAYKVSCCSRPDPHKAVTLCFVFRPTRLLPFTISSSRSSGLLRYLHIHASSNWGRTGQMRYFWTMNAAVRISSFSEFVLITSLLDSGY